MSGEIEALVTHGRRGKIETFVVVIGRGEGRIRGGRFPFHRLVLQVLLDLHVGDPVLAHGQGPSLALGHPAFPETVLGHRFVVHAYPRPLAVHELCNINTGRGVYLRLLFNTIFEDTHVFLNGDRVSER